MSLKAEKNQRGFTIIELVVVIAIIGVLSAVVSSSVMAYVRKSKIARAEAEGQNLVKALLLFKGAHGDWPYLGGTPSEYFEVGGGGNLGYNDPYLIVNGEERHLSEVYPIDWTSGKTAEYFGGENTYYYAYFYSAANNSEIDCGWMYIYGPSGYYGGKCIYVGSQACSNASVNSTGFYF